MKICGVEIKGSDAVFALAKLDGGVISHVALNTKKISLADDDDAVNVKSFAALVEGFLRDNEIGHIAIKKRGKKGEYAGGPTTFKIEGILQLLRNCEVSLLAAPTIAAQDRKHNFRMPASLLKYQQDAYRTACAAIMKVQV